MTTPDPCADCGWPHPETTESDKQKMMAALYGLGWGYNAIADLAGRTHSELRHLLMANWPADASRAHWPLA